MLVKELVPLTFFFELTIGFNGSSLQMGSMGVILSMRDFEGVCSLEKSFWCVKLPRKVA